MLDIQKVLILMIYNKTVCSFPITFVLRNFCVNRTVECFLVVLYLHLDIRIL